MRAALYDEYGGPEVLYEGEAPVPTTRPKEVLVRVHAASVNGIDVIVRAGTLRLLTGRTFPRGTGGDFAGEVVALGEGATGFSVGDRVWGCLPRVRYGGSAAELVCVPPGQLALAPENLDSSQAAALPVVGATAIIALRDVLKLEKGNKLLVRGASGGVGSVAVQLGREMGAHVTALVGASNLDWVRELGADEAVDYAVTGPADLGRFDAILDAVGSESGAYRRLLTPHGRMTTIVPDPKHPVSSILSIAASSVFGARRVRSFSAKPQTKLLADLASYVERGAIQPVVDTVYSLSAIADAHRAMGRAGKRGKEVISVS